MGSKVLPTLSTVILEGWDQLLQKENVRIYEKNVMYQNNNIRPWKNFENHWAR